MSLSNMGDLLSRLDVDVVEREDGMVLLADVPGVREQDLDIRVAENVLTIEGRRERIAPAMADAVAFAARAAREAGVTLAAITVPAPRADVSDRSAEDGRDVAGVIQLVNDSIRAAATELGLGVIDIYAHTVGADRFARPGLHLDSVHLLPSVLGKAGR